MKDEGFGWFCISVLLSVLIAFLLVVIILEASKYEKLQNELIDRGYKEYKVDNRGNTTLIWVEEKNHE